MAHAFKKMSNCRVQSFCTGVFKRCGLDLREVPEGLAPWMQELSGRG